MSRREIDAMMKDAGFYLKREGSHLIWTNGKAVITTAASPSCHRALKNIRAEIKRATRGDQMQERKIIRGESIGDALKIATTPVKTLTKSEADHRILGWANEGQTAAQIAENLAAISYVSDITGKPIAPSAVGWRLKVMGFGKKKPKKIKKASVAKEKSVAAPKVKEPTMHSDRMNAVKVLLNTMSIQADERIAMALLIIG